jgi:hypothetical protein
MCIRNQRIIFTGRACVLSVFFAVVAVYLGAFAYDCLKYTGRYSPDSVIYINTAELLLKTGTVSTSFCDLHDAMKWDALPPIPMAGYSPIYPFLIAVFALVMKPAAAALAVSLLGYGMFLVSAFLLMRHVAQIGGAMLGTAALLHFAPLAFVAVHAWSETITLVCMGLFFLLLLKARGTAGAKGVVAAGVAGGIAYLARRAMMPMVPVGIAALFRLDNPRKTGRNVMLFLGGFLVCALPVLVRERAKLPELTAGVAPLTALGEIGTAVCVGLVPERQEVQMLYVLLLAVSVVLLFQRHRSRAFKDEKRQPWSFCILAVWGLIYLATVAYARSHMFVDPLGARLVIPATSALLLCLVALFVNTARPPFWLCAAVALSLAGMAAYSELQSVRWIAGAKLPPVYEFEAQRKRCETLSWLQRNVGPKDIVIAEDGFDLPLFMGPVNVIHFFSNDGRIIAADALGGFLERHRTKFQHAYLVLKPRPIKDESDAAQSAAGLNAFRSRAPSLARFEDGEILAL